MSEPSDVRGVELLHATCYMLGRSGVTQDRTRPSRQFNSTATKKPRSAAEECGPLAMPLRRGRPVARLPGTRNRKHLTGRDARDIARVVSAVSVPGVRAFRVHGVMVYPAQNTSSLTKQERQDTGALPPGDARRTTVDGESLPDAPALSRRAEKRAQRSAARASAHQQRKQQKQHSHSAQQQQQQQQQPRQEQLQQLEQQQCGNSAQSGRTQSATARERGQSAAATAAAMPAGTRARQPDQVAATVATAQPVGGLTAGAIVPRPPGRERGDASARAPAPEPKPAPTRKLTECENCLSRFCTGGCNEYVCYDCRRTVFGWIHDEVHHLCRGCADDDDW